MGSSLEAAHSRSTDTAGAGSLATAVAGRVEERCRAEERYRVAAGSLGSHAGHSQGFDQAAAMPVAGTVAEVEAEAELVHGSRVAVGTL